MLEQSWVPQMYPFMILMMASWGVLCVEVQVYLLIVNYFALMKA